MDATQTTKLSSGHTVLARTDRHGHFGAAQYTNYSQANKKAAELQAIGVTCWVLNRGVVKYIVID